MSTFTHSSGRHISAGDANIYFETAGNPTGSPLVLLHGGLGNITDFNAILAKLPQQFRLIGIDFRGHGKSTLGSAPLTYQRYETDVEAVLNHLGLIAYSLLGFSDGGIVAYRLAAKNPSAVQALVTLGAQWRLSENDPVFEILGGLTAERWMKMFPDSLPHYNAINPTPDFKALVKAVVALWTDLQPTGYPSKTVSRITSPALLVRGDEDFLFSLDEAAELQRHITGASFFNIPFAGHEAHKESPELFLATINDFLVDPRKVQSKA